MDLLAIGRVSGSSSSSEYLEDIADFFNQDPNLFCKFDYKTLIVEDAMCMPVLNLMIRNNTLYILPAAQDNFFTCFMKFLGSFYDILLVFNTVLKSLILV